MTDNEIVKAKKLLKKLEEAYDAYYDTSKGMPYDLDTTIRETAICLEHSIDEINSQKAEIERLTKENEEQDQAIINALHRMGEIRSEAVKEFASKLTPRLLKEMDEQGLMPSAYVKKAHAYTEIKLFINEIVKEMKEDEGK